MTNGKKFLFDTNIIIALLNGEDSLINKIIREPQIHIPSIAVGELIYGAYNSKNVDNNIAAIERICAIFPVLTCSFHSAKYYGLIWKNSFSK